MHKLNYQVAFKKLKIKLLEIYDIGNNFIVKFVDQKKGKWRLKKKNSNNFRNRQIYNLFITRWTNNVYPRVIQLTFFPSIHPSIHPTIVSSTHPTFCLIHPPSVHPSIRVSSFHHTCEGLRGRRVCLPACIVVAWSSSKIVRYDGFRWGFCTSWWCCRRW